ncbi:MAG: SRPBCC family protein [Verrucomicrobiales bacterium]
MKKNEDPIVVEQAFDVPAEKIWAAITEVDSMRRWFFEEIPDFRAEVGFETVFDISNEGRTFPHRWRVTSVRPLESISYDWSFDGYEGAGAARFELLQIGDRNGVRVTFTTTEDFQDGIPEFERASGLAGWNYFIQDRLPQFLNS